ncbi:MAG: hypothetical protein SFY67_13150 [Candidatus Melainabacteria bacterium]|nr:hypothetical protein [Candidatus Melainabacteria bacterium]
MERDFLAWLTGHDLEMITAKDWLLVLRIPAITIWLLTLPIGIYANFADKVTAFFIIGGLTSTFGLMAIFSRNEKNRIISAFFSLLGFLTFLFLAVFRAAEFSNRVQ